MTRPAALRASALFIALTIVFGAFGLGSHAAVAEALFLISGSLCALMLVFALATTPTPAAIPLRVRRDRLYR
jgi:hypothetical protein